MSAAQGRPLVADPKASGYLRRAPRFSLSRPANLPLSLFAIELRAQAKAIIQCSAGSKQPYLGGLSGIAHVCSLPMLGGLFGNVYAELRFAGAAAFGERSPVETHSPQESWCVLPARS